MKIVAGFALYCSLVFAASPCGNSIPVCEIFIKTSCTGVANCYAGISQLQTAVNDAATWQMGNAGAVYVIQVDAGLSTTAHLNLANKDATTGWAYIRSSELDQLGDNRVPASNAHMASISLAAKDISGEAVTTTTNGKARNWALQGFEVTCTDPCSNVGLIKIGTGDNAGAQALQEPDGSHPGNILIDRCWIHGVPFKSGTGRNVTIFGSNVEIRNSRLEDSNEFQGDSQGILLVHGDSTRILNNYVASVSETVFHSATCAPVSPGNIGFTCSPRHVLGKGNLITKAQAMRWTWGTVVPSWGCIGDERYSQLTEGVYDGGSFGSTTSDNGSGLIRVNKIAHGYSTGDVVQVIKSQDGMPAALGKWTITVIDANNFDLQGSAIDFPITASTRPLQAWKVTNTYECSAGSFVISNNLSFDWHFKNCLEAKGGTDLFWFGNIYSNCLPQEQYQGIALNGVEPPGIYSDVTIAGSQFLNVPSFMYLSHNVHGWLHGTYNVKFQDIVAPNIGSPYPRVGSYERGTAFCPNQGFFPLVFGTDGSGFNNRVVDFHVNHVTMLTHRTSSDGGSCEGRILGAEANGVYWEPVFSNNFVTGAGSILNFAGGFQGSCSFLNATATGQQYFLSKNILEFVAQGGAVTISGAAPCSASQIYPSDHAQFNTTYAGRLTTPPTAGAQWLDGDLHCDPAYAACVASATDGTNIGADIDMVGWATSTASSGVWNVNLMDFAINSCIATGATTATCRYVAPTTAACTWAVYPPDSRTPTASGTDAGGDRARSVSVTGLTTKGYYTLEPTCNGATRGPRTDFAAAIFRAL